MGKDKILCNIPWISRPWYEMVKASFFKVRLWTQKELLEQLFVHYDRLDDDLKAELPLKRIWMVAAQEDD